MSHVFLRPGQGFQSFKRYKADTKRTPQGRPGAVGYIEDGKLVGMLYEATPQEKERWGTTDHPVSHKIVQRGYNNPLQAADMLVLVKGEGTEAEKKRFFYIQKKPRNPGDLNHCTIYYCEERVGLNG